MPRSISIPSTSLLTSTASPELRVNNATSTAIDDAMSLRDDNKPPSVTTGVTDDAADPEASFRKRKKKSARRIVASQHCRPTQCAPLSAPRIASRNPNEAVEEKLPAGHADEGSVRKPSRDDSKAAKPRWDPFARYFSDAHSFPDYGERDRTTTMGPERLVGDITCGAGLFFRALTKSEQKHINGSTKPVNTLNARRHETNDEPDVPPVKRQKKDITRNHGPTTSPFFSNSRPTKNSDIQEAAIENPHDDIYDIISTSSAGNTGNPALSVSEFRTLPSSRKLSRVRKSRASLNAGSQPQRDANGAKLNLHRFPTFHSASRGLLSIAPGSPDVLAFEDLPSATLDAVSAGSPYFSAKRDRPYRLSGPISPLQIKRRKPSTVKEPIDISDDELQADCAKYSEPNSGKSPVSRFSDVLGRGNKVTMRGDLHHTAFGKPRRQPRQSDDLGITRAVCGKWTYDRDDHHDAIFLRREGSEGKRLEPVSEDGRIVDEHAWLRIDLDQVRSFGHSETPSRYGYIMRSQAGNAGAKLYLEFDSIDGTNDFRKILHSANVVEKITDELDKKVEKAFDDAKNWIASNSTPGNSSRTYTKDGGNEDVAPASSSPDRRPGSARGKLKDSLIQSARDVDDSVAARRTEERPDLEPRRSTRATAPFTRRRTPSPVGWTELHPDWHKLWQAPLVFPPTGKNRATVDKIDIPRLDEKEFLNDNLINFYIRHLEDKLEKERPELLRKVYFFSTFFFEKLKSTKGKINYDGVKSWTAKVDLLSYDYIFVPVNEHAHWYLAIICNIPNAIPPGPDEKESEMSTTLAHNTIEVIDASSSPRLSTVERDLTDISLEDGTMVTAAAAAAQEETDGPSSRHGTVSSSVPPSPTRKRKFPGTAASKFDPTQPRIITLDSLGGPHAPTCKALREYLVEEAKTKKGIALTTVPSGMTARGIPEQNNFCDCGVFVLGYMQEFLANPDEAARKLLMKEELGWDIRPSEMRNRIRELLFSLQVDQQQQHKRLEEEKKLRKAKRKSMAAASTQNSSPLQPVVFSSPTPKLPGSFPSDSPERKAVSETALSSSESVQESNRADNDLNGTPSRQDEPKSEAVEEPQFVSTLSDGSTISPNITKGKILPISSSPIPKHDGRSSRLVVELKPLKGNDKSEFKETALVDDVQFVKELSSSSPENKVGSKTIEARTSRHSSVELIGATKNRPNSSSRMQNQRAKSPASVSPRFRVRRSIESDADHDTRAEPKYDGIDRSADNTIT
ncbi:ulp1 protease family [Trichoderma arundinaceum]|uniref:Ulp1 protease family n=1 Tax=Trichoderma arundinaceum TaxID=490622 RepID=A0A395NE84_TRIAR|nr:ulp1 protease family [Trichoderma arundinaceum]